MFTVYTFYAQSHRTESKNVETIEAGIASVSKKALVSGSSVIRSECTSDGTRHMKAGKCNGRMVAFTEQGKWVRD